MIGKLLSLVGLTTIGGYSAINYCTYKTLNHHIENNPGAFNRQTVKPVTFSPCLFNYHKQLNEQVKENKWADLRFEGVSPDNNNISVGVNVGSVDWGYGIAYKDYVLNVSKSSTY